MPIKTKLALLLGSTVCLFLVMIWLQRNSTRESIAEYSDSVATQKSESFEAVFELIRNSYQSLVIDLTFWDETVNFINDPNPTWSAENIDISSDTFEISFTLLFGLQRDLVYGYHDEQKESLEHYLPTKEEWGNLFQNGERFCSYFKSIDGEIYEVFGATIHPSDDENRQIHPSGYFIIGKRYDPSFLEQLSDATNSRVEIRSESPGDDNSTSSLNNRIVRITRELHAHDGQALAAFQVDFDFSTLTELNQRLESLSVLYGTLFSISILAFLFFTSKWIRKPIDTISTAISNEDPRPLAELTTRNHEFSGLGALVIQSFEQKRILDKARDEAEAANRAKSEFLANMSHEIRTPMNAILGFTELAKNKTHDPQILEHLNYARNGGKMLLSLIDDILDISKIEAGKLTHNPEPTHLRLLIDELIAMFHLSAKSKDLELTIEYSDSVPDHITIDPIKLRQILINLIGNAVKFTHAGSIRVHIDSNAHQEDYLDLCISVSDTGIGIPKSELERVFEVFSQQQGQDQREYGGTGLGLAISLKLAEIMQGSLSLKSEENKGSTFALHLPKTPLPTQEHLQNNSKEERKTEISDFSNRSILIVDDNEIHRLLLTSYLEDTKANVTTTENGQNAWDHLKANQVDLILADSRMPVMTGYELLQNVRLNEVQKDIPFVIISAGTMKVDREDTQIHTADATLSKPIDQATLISVCNKFLKISSPN